MAITVLDYVQDILSSIDSDEVNSISDTTESAQVARVVKQSYYALLPRLNLPDDYQLYELNPSLDMNKPTLMYVPSTAESLIWIKYNNATLEDTTVQYRDVCFQPLEIFLNKMYLLSENEANVGTFTHVVDSSSLTFLFNNDRHPLFYTTPDDHTLIFDSYLADVDTTLQSTKSLAYGKIQHNFTMSDTFVPFSDNETSTILLNEAKSLAFAELKQSQHAKAEQTVRKLMIHNQKAKRAVNQDRSELDRLPNYARRPTRYDYTTRRQFTPGQP
jgi:hypothetical protein